MASLVLIVVSARFGSIARTNRHIQTDADERYSPATLVGVNNNRDRRHCALTQYVSYLLCLTCNRLLSHIRVM